LQLPPNVVTNRPEQLAESPTSVTVVLLDAVNTRIQDQVYAKQQFLKFLGQIQPEDRVAVYALGTRLRVLNDFSNDSRRLVAAVARYRGQTLPLVDLSQPDPSDTGDADMDTRLNQVDAIMADAAIVNRMETTVAAMEAIANHLASVPGRKAR
jgi:VWFA-related protein